MTVLIKGLGDRVEVVSPDAADIAALRAKNPLSKIPVLFTDAGTAIYDSHVICEYLDSLAASPSLFPNAGDARWNTLTLAAMGDGMLDAALLLVYEGRYRPEEMRVQSWVDMQQAKIDGALGVLEAQPPTWSDHPDYGDVTIATALGYLDFRHGGAWREGHPAMVAWLDNFAAVVLAFGETMPEG
ncbi:MAG: glutathione S-transferase family protein [Chromatiales bacterium]|jgi:glutathione S-transferase|nr:glutathione S-transferase family protein [Chromatiales bacterium]